LELIVNRNLQSDDVILSVEFSGDLHQWTRGRMITREILENGLAAETWVDSLGRTDVLFARLRAQ
jgi:hypothetical protein